MVAPISPVLTTRLAVTAAALVCALGIAVFAGWLFDIGWLLTPYPDTVAMKANTALGLALGGAAVSGLAVAPGSIALIRGCAALVATLGALTLTEYIAGVDLGIDTLVVTPNPAQVGEFGGRMSPSTAICFVLTGAGVLSASFRTYAGTAVAAVLHIAMLIIALIGVVGYVYGAPVFYLGNLPVEAMAVHTAAGFLVLATAALLARPPDSVALLLEGRTLAARHFRALLPASVALPLAIGAVALLGHGAVYGTKTAVALTALGSALAIALVVTATHILLDRSEQFLMLKDRALEAIGVGVIITDHRAMDEPIVYANRAFSDITGYAEHEVLGRNCRFLNQGSRNKEENMTQLREAIRTGSECQIDLRNKRQDGSEFWNSFALAPVRGGEDEAVSHFVGVIDDVSTDIEREKRLTRAMHNLTRTTQTMETFVRIVSHELRGPLNAASTWVALMDVDRSAENVEQGLQAIQQSIDDQARLISDLVEASQAAMPSLDLEITHVELDEVLEQLVDDWLPRIEAADQTISIELPTPGSCPLAGDVTRLRQIFGNLISNAHKYSPAGAHVRVTLERTGDELVVEVADNGKGIAADDLHHVFETSWRADRSVHGLGLGLSIVKELVEAHGGTVTVESSGAGLGTRFTVRLPGATLV